MDKKTIYAIGISFIILLGWQKFYVEPQMNAQQQKTASPAESAQSKQPTAENASTKSSPSDMAQAAAVSVTLKPSAAVSMNSAKTQQLSFSLGKVEISNGNNLFSNFSLQGFKTHKQDAQIGLESVVHQKGTLEIGFDSQEYAYLSGVFGEIVSASSQVKSTYEDSKIKLEKTVEPATDGNSFKVNISAQFKGAVPKNAFVTIAGASPDGDEEEVDRQFVYWSNKEISRAHLVKSDALKEITTPISWMGVTSRYFLFSVISKTSSEPTGVIQSAGERSARMSLRYPVSGSTIQIPLQVYFGPKDLDVLRKVEPTFDHTVDFGWFTVFAYPILKMMKWLYQFLQNYGVAIIILTIIIKILTFPLTYKSMVSMKKMAEMQPQIKRLQDKYKDDKEALNREMLTLMKSGGYNPISGCLPLFIQMPVFFALYRVLYSSIELYQAPFGFWIHDLSQKDPFYVTPIVLTIVMYLQQKLTPNTATDPAQAKMIQFMPLIFGFMMISLPAGLTIYMLTNALTSILQQVILNKKLGLKPAAST